MTMAVLELDNVFKSFSHGFLGRKHQVLSGLSFHLEQGEVYGFLGHNGTGKTTTMRLIMGLLRPNSGSIRVFGKPGVTRQARSRIGFLGDDVGLYPHLSAEEMLNFAGELFRLSSKEIRARRNDLLERFEMEEFSAVKIKKYSKGMRQRVGICVALMNNPELLLLDEPYAGLDPIGRRQLRELLLSLRDEGKTILLSSHIVPDVEAVCDRVGILSSGRISRCLNLREIFSPKSAPCEVTLGGVTPQFMVQINSSIEVIYHNSEVVVVRCEGQDVLKSVITRVIESRGNVLEIKPIRFNLEDYLIEELEQEEHKTASKSAERELDYAKSGS
jgi:ABC-2 type transport system ATP-binding protein